MDRERVKIMTDVLRAMSGTFVNDRSIKDAIVKHATDAIKQELESGETPKCQLLLALN